MSTPTPSPCTKPSARASKGRHTPVGLMAPTRVNAMRLSGVRLRYTPPAKATSMSPARRCRMPSAMAAEPAAQAASTV